MESASAPQPELPPSTVNENKNACKVLVSGYPPYTRAEDLVLVLTKFGTVTVDRKGKRQAVLTYGSEREAQAALAGHRTMVIYGEYLNIKPYTTKASEDSKPTTPKRDFPKSKEKSTIIEPKDIDLSGDFYQQVDRILGAIRLTQEDVNALSAVYVDLENVLQTLWPGCKAMPFGSITTGLGIKTSDADCFVNVPAQWWRAGQVGQAGQGPRAGQGAQAQLQAQVVNRAKRLLQAHPALFAEVLSIPRANTPLVKLFHLPTATNCDLSFKTPLGVQNSKLIAFLLHSDPRLVPLAVLLKYWAKVHGLSGTGKITNYALVLMILFYVQQPPRPILPTVEWLQRDASNDLIVDFWNAGFMFRRELMPANNNKSTICELVGGFFDFYNRFNFEEMVVCPYLGVPIKKMAFSNFSMLPAAFQRYKNNVLNNIVFPIRNDTEICVQDPIDHSHNVSSAASNRTAIEIKAYIKFAVNAYDKEKINNNENFLRTILLQKPKLIRTKSNPEYRVYLFPRIVEKIQQPDWKSVVREIMFVIYEKMLKIKLGKIEEKVHPDAKKEKEKFMGVVTKAIWKRKNFYRLYSAMDLNFESKHERITEEILKVEKEELQIHFQLILTYCHNPRSALVSIRMNSGNAEAYREFGKFFITVMQNWFEELLKPYIMVQGKNRAEKMAEDIQSLNEMSLNETKKIDDIRQIIEADDSDDSS